MWLLLLFMTALAIKGDVITQEFLNQIPPVNFSLATATKSDVQFALFTQKIPEGIAVSEKNISQANFDKNANCKTFIHGYQGSWRDAWYSALKETYFNSSSNISIIYVDWSGPASVSYPESSANINSIADYIADFLIASRIASTKIHVIGASLGGQLVGHVGKSYFKKSGKKIARITGLDPAKPGFIGVAEENRLNEGDAQFVDVIHTDSQFLGYGGVLGHVDFYPNGGKNQPGCPPTEIDSFCSHSRAVILFVESVSKPEIRAVKAKLTENSEVEVLSREETTVFGDKTAVNGKGVYFLPTGSAFPFLRPINKTE